MSDPQSQDNEKKNDNNEIKKVRKSEHKEISFFRIQTNSFVRYLFLKWQNTRMANNIDCLARYQKIYNHLTMNKLPIMKGGERRRKAKRVE